MKLFGIAEELVRLGLAEIDTFYGEMSELYDTTINETDDIPFYLSLAQKCCGTDAHPAAGRILDIGCGTGRILMQLLRNGYQVDGLDISAQMLSLTKAKLQAANLNTALYQCDMRQLDSLGLTIKYNLVIIPYATMIYMLSDSDRLAVFRGVRNLLARGGVLAFDFDAGQNEVGISKPWISLQTVDREQGRSILRIAQMHGISPDLRYVAQITWLNTKSQGKIVVSFEEEASVSAAHMQGLLAQAGFSVTEMAGDYHGQPYSGGELCLITARADH